MTRDHDFSLRYAPPASHEADAALEGTNHPLPLPPAGEGEKTKGEHSDACSSDPTEPAVPGRRGRPLRGSRATRSARGTGWSHSIGFTLIEMMITLTVLVLMLFTMATGIGNWMDNARIRGVAESLKTGLETARMEALRRNQNVSFWLVSLSDPAVLGNDCALSSASPSWMVSVSSPLAQCDSAPSETVAPRVVTGHAAGSDGHSVLVTALQGDGRAATRVTFNGFGRVVPDAMAPYINQIDVTNMSAGETSRNLRLLVSPVGQVRLCDPRATTAGDPRKC